MALIKRFKGIEPDIDSTAYLAENCTVVGDVKIGKYSSVWYQTVIRGDVNPIVIGDEVNIQDLAMVHCTTDLSSVKIGNKVTIGHSAIIHGCTIEDNVLIGMGAIVMDNAIVHSNTIVAAGAVVLENMKLESGFIYAGIPAKKVKSLDINSIHDKIKASATHYVNYAKDQFV